MSPRLLYSSTWRAPTRRSGTRYGEPRLTKAGLRHRDDRVISACCDRGIPIGVTPSGGEPGGGGSPDVGNGPDIHSGTIAAL